MEKGLWTVSFYEKNRSEKVQCITVSYNGKVINKPADLLGERMIPTAFVVK